MNFDGFQFRFNCLVVIFDAISGRFSTAVFRVDFFGVAVC